MRCSYVVALLALVAATSPTTAGEVRGRLLRLEKPEQQRLTAPVPRLQAVPRFQMFPLALALALTGALTITGRRPCPRSAKRMA
jgi:hypothetical protein